MTLLWLALLIATIVGLGGLVFAERRSGLEQIRRSAWLRWIVVIVLLIALVLQIASNDWTGAAVAGAALAALVLSVAAQKLRRLDG